MTCGQCTGTNQIVNKWSSEVQISCIKKIIGHSPEWLMPCTCILVCTCSRVQVTPMDIPNKQICTPVMFFVCVVCSCTNGIEITCAACKPLCHTPTTSYLITQSLVWIRWHMYRTFLNPVSNCALDISLPFENVSNEFFAVQLLREETGIHFFASSISNSRLSNIPPPPDSTVNWDSRSNRIWPSPCQSASHYYEKGKVSAKHVT